MKKNTRICKIHRSMLKKSDMKEVFMKRCFDLARLGKGYVAPNPTVGAVLVHQNRIIGEGFHQRYGRAHAEVNAVLSVAPEDRPLIASSTLYVSLEPCCFHGKTPACTSLILDYQIPRVVISCLDNSPEVAGQGVKLLRSSGVEVTTGVLEEEGKKVARIRSRIVAENRPYVMLKYARTLNGKFAPSDKQQRWISHPMTKRLTHKWRSEANAILVGTNTARIDDPQLTNRHYFGPSPLRLVIDKDLSLPKDLKMFRDDHPTVIITEQGPPQQKGYSNPNLRFMETYFHERLPMRILKYMQEQKMGILMIEGGVQLINSFIEQGYWDEARVIVGNTHWAEGLDAPQLPGTLVERKKLGEDEILLFHKS
jgi:diaminohydroxyphosphoribosylaminopyrimidine deaminase/5-amino-6-(5-phosphoribosylamino)uracil reductase